MAGFLDIADIFINEELSKIIRLYYTDFGKPTELIGNLYLCATQREIKLIAHVLYGLESAIVDLKQILTLGNKGKLIVKLQCLLPIFTQPYNFMGDVIF